MTPETSQQRQQQYIDVREIHPDYTQVPCRDCDALVWVQQSFAYHHDEAFCSEHAPEISVLKGRRHVEVRL